MRPGEQAYRNECSMFRRALLLQPLAQAADSNASSVPDRGVDVLDTSLDNGPDLAYYRSHVFATTLNDNTKSKHGAAAIVRIRRGEILLDERAKGREDLGRRKVRR
jgi:hypothetical protein